MSVLRSGGCRDDHACVSLPGIVHPGQVCNGCGLDPITGMMWKCVRCHEYSICTECYMTGKHILDHEFDRFVTPE